MSRLRGSLLGLLAGLTVACDAGELEVGFVVRDSVGLQIIEFDADRIDHEWIVGSEPEWVIGDEPGDAVNLPLHAIIDAAVIDARRVVIAEGSTQEVILVDLSVGEVSRWGGAGDGPEELRGISRLFDLEEGRIGVYDRARLRVLEYDDGGRVLDVFQVASNGGVGEAPLIEIVGRSPEERTVFLAHIRGLPAEPVEGAYRGTGPLVRVSANGVTDTLGIIHGSTSFWRPGVGAGAVLFGATTVISPGDEGLWVGDTDQTEVVSWGTTGERTRIVRWSSTGTRELTEERTHALWDHLAASVSEAERAMVAQLREMVPVAERVPAFGALQAGPDGTLWIGEPLAPEVTLLERPSEPQSWMVVDFEAGRIIEVTTPRGVQVLRVGSEYLLGLHRDESGVESVRRYPLRKTGGME